MSNNFLISMRNDEGFGLPGPKIGPTAFIEILEKEKNYDLRLKINRELWLNNLYFSGKKVLVFVHGFADGSEKVIDRHKSIKLHLPPDMSLVSFDWPAGNPGSPKESYEKDKANAKETAPRLMKDCFELLRTAVPTENLHLFAHSMGAYVTETAFQGLSTVRLNHVLMAAADVDQLNYVKGSTFLVNFLSKCRDLTAYWSTDDAALHDSEDLNKYTPLGLKGYPEPDTPGGCYGIQCTTYYNRYVKYQGQPDTYSHIWYILYPPNPGPINDFYTDLNRVLQGPPAPLPPPPPWPTRATGFVLRRPG